MAQHPINEGDSGAVARGKINDDIGELYTLSGGGAANTVIRQGNWNPSIAFPTAGASTKAGHTWNVSVAGVKDGVSFNVGDDLRALVDNPSSTVYAANWVKESHTQRPYWLGQNKTVGKPNVIVTLGQSNNGFCGPALVTDFTGIKIWQNNAAHAMTQQFITPSPNTNYGYMTSDHDYITGLLGQFNQNYYNGSLPVVNVTSNHIALKCARTLVDLTGEESLIISVYRGGSTMAEWAPGDMLATGADDEIAAAIAWLNSHGYPTIDKVDLVIWSQGESDSGLGGMTYKSPEQYATEWKEMKEYFETTWATAGYTQWFVPEIAQGYYGTWDGINRAVAQSDSMVRMIGTQGATFTADGFGHLDNVSLDRISYNAALAYLQGPAEKNIAPRDAKSLRWRSGTSSNVPNGASAVAYDLDTDVALSAAGAKLLRLKNFGTEKFSVDKDGQVTGAAYGNMTGIYVSALANAAATAAHAFYTGPYTTGYLLGLYNDAVLKFRIESNGGINTSGEITTPKFYSDFFGDGAFFMDDAGFNTGIMFSGVADGASAVGFDLVSSAMANAGAKLLRLKNDTAEKFAVLQDGSITMGPGASGAVWLTQSVASGSTSSTLGLLINALNAQTGTARLTTWWNGFGVTKAYIQQDGAMFLAKGLGVHGKAPPSQHTGGGSATPSTAGSSTGLFQTTKWSGGTGSSEYNMNDVVKCMKDVGLLAA